jgi:hypothetical protein
LSFSRRAELVVMTETISIPGATAIVTSVLTGPRMMRVMEPARELRALIFICSPNLCGLQQV